MKARPTVAAGVRERPDETRSLPTNAATATGVGCGRPMRVSPWISSTRPAVATASQ
ncbi:hypothetical protein QIS99_01870 [Streptomyces sp. B-S-A8]|uniref:Uncharacterized protein n=1 Tax=Streptomyces solicavernae TaxID=3043614 RepID=A0ABT6RKL6_9ACTN|nr:hypothetical protein [Streptomyces sp. B-S-A8]MDI3384967.1 hypothetical protein [Streptomyces sp. B-S-A8]